MPRPLLAVLVLSIVSCGAALPEPRDWRFVQAVGGIAIEQPTRHSDGWTLPVRADVSGTRAITVKPTLLNSALSCDSVQATVDGSAIYLTIATRPAGGGRTSLCPPADLGRQEQGVYSVLYRSPDMTVVRLGAVQL